jgi:hypothetical protein
VSGAGDLSGAGVFRFAQDDTSESKSRVRSKVRVKVRVNIKVKGKIKVKGPALANYGLERGTLELIDGAVGSRARKDKSRTKATAPPSAKSRRKGRAPGCGNLLGLGWGGGIPCVDYTRRPLFREWRALEKS